MRPRSETVAALALAALVGAAGAPGSAFAEAEAITVPKASREPLAVRRAGSAITVDGVLDEPAWAEALTLSLAYEFFPGDGIEPPAATDALVTYDDDRLYVAFRAYDPEPARIRAHLMDRDDIDTFVQDDHVVLMVDTFNDERRAVQLRVNPLGVQVDAIFSENEGVEDFAWDIIWNSAGRITEEGYAVELAVPFNQLSFPRTPGAQTWGFELSRSYPRSERHRISAHWRDRNRSCILCQVVKISGFEGLEPGLNLELTPTLTASRTDRREDFPSGDLEAGDEEVEPGLTARWGLTPNLTLSATLNPDFSQVEADVAQLDVNERFALFFPEKRPFFLEGVDLFATPINAVFTRTIVDPDWGIKLTGKEGRNALGVFAAGDEVTSLLVPSNQGSRGALLDEPSTAAVLRYRRDVGANSTLGVLYAGREGDGYHNRVGGVDGFLRFDGRNTLSFQYLSSDTRYPSDLAAALGQPADAFGGHALKTEWDYDSRTWNASLEYADFASGFRADSGFVTRVDLRQLEGFVGRSVWGEEDDWYSEIFVGLFAFRTEDQGGRLTDQKVDLFANVQGPLQSFIEVSLERNRTLLGDVLYDELDRAQVFVNFQPAAAVKLELFVDAGETVDVVENRRADLLQLTPELELKLGRHLNAQLSHSRQTLEVDAGTVFEVDLSQLRLVYQFNVRTFARAILQYQDLERDPDLFSFPVEPQTEELFTQLLFSYKLNPQTVLFAGYSEGRLGLAGVDLTQTDRTFFLKLGYAWVL